MIKKSLFKTPIQFYHLSFQYRSTGWFKELEWIRHCRTINGLALTHKIECIAYVMMDTHAHMLIRSLDSKENYFAEEILKALANEITEPEFLEPIGSSAQFLTTYRYIYRNPVDAGLVRQSQSYPYSTLHSLLGHSVQRLIVWDCMNVIQDPARVLNWINNEEPIYKQPTW